jgi:hypothetical protein
MFAQCIESEEMHEFLEAITESGLAAHIKSQEIHPVPPQSSVHGFTIVR